jgi:hypothetical protein
MAVEDLERLDADVSLVIALGLIPGPITSTRPWTRMADH